MIIDTSALIAILRDEFEAISCAHAIENSAVRRMSAANFVEPAVILETFRPHLNDGRRFSIIGRLGQQLARIWHRLGLNVVSGRSNHQGTFQRFTQLARIAVVGDDSRLSNRQVTNLKSRIRRERDSESKSLKQLPL
jgi:uncharacterized protein with PIN domain